MNFKAVALAVLFTGFLVFGAQTVYGAQLSAIVDPDKDLADFEVTYQRSTFIEHGNTGQIADMLNGRSWVIQESSSTPEPDAIALRNALNQKIASDGSGTQISDLTVEYSATLTGRQLNTAIDYKVTISGTLTDYKIAIDGAAGSRTLIDLGWRGMSVNGPVMINGIEINMPISALKTNEPGTYAHIQDSTAESLLSRVLINADRVHELELPAWHFLFNPAGISSDAARLGLADEIKGHVLSQFTMGESSLREGRQVESDVYAEFTADKIYKVRSVQSADSAEISAIGFAAIDRLGDVEIIGVTPTAPEGYGNTSTGGFPVTIIYGMAGLAAVGGGAFFIFSNRQLKKEKNQGQTGIDPSRLTGRQTSASSGGYQTNRGEAQLKDSTDYAQTRSVYDNAGPQDRQPALASSEASCGCAASADSDMECDCEMQGQCLCDSTCGCSSGTCKDAVRDMQ